MDTITPPSLPARTTKPLTYWVIIIVLLIYSTIVTVLLVFKPSALSLQGKLAAPDSSKFFTAQTAILKGKITEARDSRIKVINSRGETGVVDLSKNVIINDGATIIASSSAQTKSIRLNIEATIALNVIDGNYQAISISFEQPVSTPSGVLPLPPPVASGAAIPALPSPLPPPGSAQ